MSVGGSTATAKKDIHNVFPRLKKSSQVRCRVFPITCCLLSWHIQRGIRRCWFGQIIEVSSQQVV